jgi:hypothetical protein
LQKQFAPNADFEHDRRARLALKYAALIERKFNLIAEEEFTTYTYYDSVQEAIDDLFAERMELWEKLEPKTKRRVREVVNLMRTKKGVVVPENTS